MITINQALDTIMQLDFYSREMLLEIMHKRQIEARREEIRHHARIAKASFKKGTIKSLSATETIKALNELW